MANGFSIGSNRYGTEQAKGSFDELETFNYPLDPDSIRSEFEITWPYLNPPSVAINGSADGSVYSLSLSHSLAQEIKSTVSLTSFPNPTELLITRNYADSVLARAVNHYDSGTVGINCTKLP